MDKMYSRVTFVAIILLLFTITTPGYSNDYSFYINQFEVKLNASTRVGGQQLIELVMSLRNRLNRAPTEEEILQALVDRTLTGPASIKIAEKAINLTLHDVKIKKTRHRLPLTDRFVAVEGYVSGRDNVNIDYTISGFPVRLKTRSINITLDDATARTEIRIPFRRIGVERDDALVLESSQADIDPNGAVCGNNFKCKTILGLMPTIFKPRDSKYVFKIMPQTNNKVNISNHQSCSNYIKGISLTGTAKRNLVTLSFSATISPGIKEIFYKLNLDAPIELEPECQYFLKLHTGEIVYRYVRKGMTLFNPLVLKICTGSFKADLQLPPSVPTVDGETIELREIILKTDSSGALFGKAQVPKCRVGSLFQVECVDSNAWIYFDNWAENNRHYECVEKDPIDPFCENVYSLFASRNELYRPGLTILSGRLFFKAPQASVDMLHTIFWGALTITPTGLTGELSTGEHTLVPLTKDANPIQNIAIRPTLDEIIDKQNQIPESPAIHFKLSDLKIIEMNIFYLRFCHNFTDSSLIVYNAYFPHPSHLNITFVDVTLDKYGYFHNGYGPVTTKEYLLTEYDEYSKIGPEYGAQGTILWFWRLPMLLYSRGTEIKHKTSLNEQTTIHINIADLGVSPLSSTDPKRIGGVPFTAELTTEGGFELLTHDTSNWFGKFGAHDFHCALNSIMLAPLAELPNDRDYDLEWWGIIDFPFFDSTEVNFFVRNVIPMLKTPLFVDTVRTHILNINDSLYAKADNIKYSYTHSGFSSDETMYKKRKSEQYVEAHLTMESIISAYIVKIGGEVEPPKTIIISEEETQTDCKRPKKVITRMIDATLSSNEFDLVCYDEEANDYRIDDDFCGKEYYRGTYEIASTDENNNTTIILTVPNTKYYHNVDPPILDANHSNVTFRSDEYSTTESIPLYVPGMHLYIEDGIVSGQINAKLDIGEGIPLDIGYDIVFFLNTKCGWFYFYAEVGFFFIVHMDGQLLVAHSRIHPELSTPIDCLAEKAGLSYNKFMENCLFPSEDTEVVTCVVVSGGFRPPLPVIEIRIGGGYFYAQQQGYAKLGGYWVAEGEVNAYIASVGVSGTFIASWTMPGHTIELSGIIEGDVCVSALIGHCTVGVWVKIKLYSDGNYNVDWGGINTDCGWGGC